MLDKIIVRGAREHNLKNITVEIPRGKLTVVTGLSGSGKSTLAFDTIYAEGQRRYVESLSSYARQFLGLMNKPDVDSIEGLSPAISIEQKSTSKNPRSTVATVTEIYDYLRLLYARIGVHHCPLCKTPIKPQSAENIVNLVMTDKKREAVVLAPIIRGLKGTYEKVLTDLRKDGYARIRVDGKIYRTEDIREVKLKRYEKHWIDAVVDRFTINEENRQRITEAIEHGLAKGDGTIVIIDPDKKDVASKQIARGSGEQTYSSFGACPKHPRVVFEELEPRMFSFNSPFGACELCHGLGSHSEISCDLVIPDKSKSIMDGAIAVYNKMDITWRSQQIAAVGKVYGFDLFTPIDQFSNKNLKILLNGTEKPIRGRWHDGGILRMDDGWEGIVPQSMRLYQQTESEHRKEELEKYMVSSPCQKCKGRRLKENMLAVHIQKRSIIDITEMSIKESLSFFRELPDHFSRKEMLIAKQVLKEINDRLGFLSNVGLGYLTLERTARTLSGGEAQRIRLATQIGSNLMGVLYILDEPSIGLHQRDNLKLINTLKTLRDIGNTLLVVEHDEETIRAADHIIDIGPGAGVHGGHICAQGSAAQVIQQKRSITGRYLSGALRIAAPKTYRKQGPAITLTGALENNLKNLTVHFPTQVLCAITGVSGSGKSTLMNQTLMPALKKHFGSPQHAIGKFRDLKVPSTVDNVIVIDQEPIGRTPRSNPATYTKLFDDIRALFAMTRTARARGYKTGRFSFNVKGGRCETCSGEGVLRIEMNFLPDVFVPCEDCKGKRYNSETLTITFKDKTIADVLDMSVEEAFTFFRNLPSVHRKLLTLYDVGLGYIKLGQSSTTLSGGESQRIKLTRELSKVKKGSTLYLLDEPTTGLHFEDVRKLIKVLNRLVDKGNTIYIIEHNLDVIKSSDYVIDLGPEGGDAGGETIAQGTPREITEIRRSYTGTYLRSVMNNATPPSK